MNLTLSGEIAGLLAAIVVILAAIVHVAFAAGVFKLSERRPTELVGGWVWVAGTLLGGPFVAVAFWALHLSRFARPAIRDHYRDAASYRN